MTNYKKYKRNVSNKNAGKTSHQGVGTAPYNFVPLPERIVMRYNSIDELPTHDASRKEDRDLLSGEITFKIVAQNPILVADGMQDDGPRKFVKNVNGMYEIPGSSLRGLMRNVVSVLSLSDWTEQMDDERFFYRSVGESSSTIGKHYKQVLNVSTNIVNNKRESVPQNVKAGYIAKMKDGNYCIYHAKTDGGRLGKTYYKVNNGNITIRKNSFANNVKRGFFVEEATFSINENGKVVKLFHDNASFRGHLLYSGYIRTGKTNKVSAYLINEIDKEKKPIHIRMEDIKAYKADLKYRLSKFQKNNRERMKDFFELPEKPGLEHAKPCFYIEYDNVTYFGFTAFLRLLYPNSTKNLLPDQIINKGSGVDYASALFGFTVNSHSKLKSNYASRLHFHSATIKGNVQPLKPVHVILGSPRASANRFYINQDNKMDTNNYNTYLNKDATIRGMKQYWIKDVENVPVDEKRQSSMTQLEVLPKQTTFEAKITFDQLHEDELGLLLWALKGPKYHQLGMGKPYGYGVVSFEAVTCSITNNKKMYEDITNIFDFGQKEIDSNEYIEKYKAYVIDHLRKSGVPLDESFKIEDFDSIRIFFAMKEKSRLPREEMQYTSLKQYSKVNLPSAKQLLQMDGSVQQSTDNRVQKKESSGTSPSEQEKSRSNEAKKQGVHRKKQNTRPKSHQKKGSARKNTIGNRSLTHNPFANALKNFDFKK